MRPDRWEKMELFKLALQEAEKYNAGRTRDYLTIEQVYMGLEKEYIACIGGVQHG